MITLPASISPPMSYIEREYITISPDVSLSTAIATLTRSPRCVVPYDQEPEKPPQSPVSPTQTCILVVNAEQQLIGLLTERDIVRFVARQIDLETVLISEVMTRNVITHPEAEPTDPVSLIHQMRHHRIRHLPVVDPQNRPTGIITPSSIRATLQPADLLKWRLVEEAMSTRLIHALPSASVAQIAQQMADERVSCVVIAEPTDIGALLPLGIVTEHDIVQFQLLQLSLDLTAEAVMSAPLFTVSAHISVWTAHQTMQTYHVRRLGVTNSKGELVGILTQTSILQSVDVAELHQVISSLQKRVQVLQQENIKLLEQINQDLQVQIDEQSGRLATQLDRETVLLDIALRIRSSLDLDTILQTTVQEVRDRLQSNRVVIARFHRPGQGSTDWRAQVVVEAVENPQWSLLGQVLHNDCLEEDWLLAYRENQNETLRFSHPVASSVCSDMPNNGVQARASLSVPIWVDHTLWGILVAHQVTACRIWKPDEQQFLEQLAVHVAIAIRQATLLEQVQKSRADLEARVMERTDQLQQELAERERVEASLRESEERFQAFMNHAPMLSWITDRNGVMIYANAAWMEFVGTTPETTLGNSIRDLIPAAIADEYLANNQQVIETGKAIEVIEPRIRQDGSQRQYLIRKFPIQLHQHQHETWIGGIGLDITERLESDLKLRTSEENFRQLAENPMVVIIGTSRSPLAPLPFGKPLCVYKKGGTGSKGPCLRGI
ncbi:MAG: CBS domain-containing protein [Synechococcales cyanobacterium T60_A2020_003]|nr:CBS domain-containing protein [Synechococcales cyanobacterium T60_A2020_003]